MNSQLSLQTLTHKVAMLFALANADRCSDLGALDLNHRTYQGNGVKFIIPGQAFLSVSRITKVVSCSGIEGICEDVRETATDRVGKPC